MKELKQVLKSIHNTIVFDSKDWTQNRRDAWIYGIVVGWDDASYNELQQKFRWDEKEIERNKYLHSVVNKYIGREKTIAAIGIRLKSYAKEFNVSPEDVLKELGQHISKPNIYS